MSTVLRDAVILARNTFEGYAALHREKGTPDGDAKAALNNELATHMNVALDKFDREAQEDLDRASEVYVPQPSAKTEPYPVLGWMAGMVFAVSMLILLVHLTGTKAMKPQPAAAALQAAMLCESKNSPLPNVGAMNVYTFGGTFDGKVGFFLPAGLAGEFKLVDISKGRENVMATAWIDPLTRGVIIDVNDVRIGVR